MLLRLVKETFLRRKRRVVLALLAVLLGSSLISALLTVYGDITGKMSQELRSYGANILVRPGSEVLELEIGGISYSPPGDRALIDERQLPKIKTIFWRNNIVGFAPFLSVVVQAGGQPIVLTGTWFEKKFSVPNLAPRQFESNLVSIKVEQTFTTGIKGISPWWQLKGKWVEEEDLQGAIVGISVANKLGIAAGDSFTLYYEGKPITLRIAAIVSTGGFEDNQIFVNLPLVQKLVDAPYGVDKVLVSALVTPNDKVASSIKGKNPDQMTPQEYELWYCTPLVESISYQISEVVADTKSAPIRQISESESVFLSKTEFLVLLITGISLIASAMGVMTTMTTMVMERRKEIGLMKAIGAQNSQIAWIFLLEAGIIGLIGGLAGYAGGLALVQFLGREVFGMKFSFSNIAFPVTIIIAISIALAGSAIPVRRAMEIEPVKLLKEM